MHNEVILVILVRIQERIPVGCVPSAAVAMPIPARTGQGGVSQHALGGGVSAQGGVCLGGCLPRGSDCPGGVCPGGV